MLGTLLLAFQIPSMQGMQAMGAAAGAACIAFAISLCTRAVRRNKTLPTAFLACMLALLLLLVQTEKRNRQTQLLTESETAEVLAVPAALPYMENGRQYILLQVQEWNGEPADFRFRLVMQTPQAFSPYAVLRCTVKPFQLGSTAYPQAMAYYRAKGIVGGGLAESTVQTVSNSHYTLRTFALDLQGKVRETVVGSVHGDAGGVLAALTVGATRDLSPAAKTTFRSIGLAHLFAVSGLHLTIWTWMLYTVLRVLGLRRRHRAVCGFLFLVFFTALTGFSPSVLRAAFMCAVLWLGDFVKRESEPLNTLGLALTVLLCQNPFAAADASLLLSVFSTGGILLCSPPLEQALLLRFRRVRSRSLQTALRGGFGILALTGAASVATLPVQMLLFGTVPLLSLLSNILCLQIGTAAMLLGSLGAILCLCGLPAFGSAVLSVAAVLATVLLRLSDTLAYLPHAVLPLHTNAAIALLAVILLCIAGILLLRRPSRRFLRGAALCLCLLFLGGNLALNAVRESRLQMAVCRVGSGVGVVLRLRGETVLLCSGGDGFAESEICAILSKYGVTKLDALLLASADTKAAAAALAVGRQYTVGVVYCLPELSIRLPDGARREALQKTVLQLGGSRLLLAADATGDTAYAEVRYGTFRALIILRGTPDFQGASGSLLVCGDSLPKNIDFADFEATVVSAESPVAADAAAIFSKSVYTTAENGSILLFVHQNGTMQMTRGNPNAGLFRESAQTGDQGGRIPAYLSVIRHGKLFEAALCPMAAEKMCNTRYGGL